MIPWWGWVIIAVVAMVGVYYALALAFFHKASKHVFRTFDDVRDAHFTADPRDPFPHLDDPFKSMEDRVNRMTGPGRDPFKRK